ncbi:MAG: hypothetical protein MK081_02685 [Flavobacteriales bacterium]|nr:hypothetical protein [Flavobacteriales bacterium]
MRIQILSLLSTFLLSIPVGLWAQTTPLPNPGVSAMELAWFHPKETPAQVEVNDHLEVGFKLQQTTKVGIENYLDDRPVPNSLNPFDPEQLNVVATFDRISAEGEIIETQQRYGFWYRNYERNFAGNVADNWNHREIRTKYSFRVRFTPQVEGKWRVKVAVITNQQDTVETNSTEFTSVASERPGFVALGENNSFLTRDDKTFFPVGQNLPWPTCTSEIDERCEEIYCAGKEAWCHARIMGPYGFKVFEDEMSLLEDGGANYVRVLLAPWNLEIEFEKLNNYDERMHCAWEMDHILEHAESIGLLLHLNLQVHYPLENPSVYSMFHWDYDDLACSPWDEPYCYFDELNLKTPREFFASAEARKHYQNRIRYLIARYGHSTSIGVLELLSEANNAGKGPTMDENCLPDKSIKRHEPYYNEEGFAALVADWHWDMARFIKEDLQHTDHLLALNYTGAPHVVLGDNSYYSPHVDICSWNNYNLSIDKYTKAARDIRNFQQKRQKGEVTNYDPLQLDKPIMYGEIGPGLEGIHNCDNNIRWIKAAWVSSFTGLAGTGINWNKQHDPDLWKTYKNITTFMNSLPLDEWDFENHSDLRSDKTVELISLKSTDKGRMAAGVVNNLTMNFYTMRDTSMHGTPCEDVPYLETIVLWKEYQDALSIAPEKGGNRLEIPCMGLFMKYNFVWTNPFTGEVIEETEVRSNLAGRLVIEHPTLKKDGPPFLVFKAIRKNG